MLFRDTVRLISFTDSINNIGDPVETRVYTSTIFANKKSIRQSEFYQAHATGLRPELSFIIREADYSQQPALEYDSKDYRIIRTFSKNGELIELICEGITNGVI